MTQFIPTDLEPIGGENVHFMATAMYYVRTKQPVGIIAMINLYPQAIESD